MAERSHHEALIDAGHEEDQSQNGAAEEDGPRAIGRSSHQRVISSSWRGGQIGGAGGRPMMLSSVAPRASGSRAVPPGPAHSTPTGTASRVIPAQRPSPGGPDR